MHFKHPEILYFLFLLIVPILVHLFQLRRFKKSYFTNVRLLAKLSIQTRKSSKIKKWLLLATRLLLLTCLIFAFAQPYFTAKDSKNANNEMYIILDNSFSMQAKGKKGELLKRSVQELLENTPENAQFSLLTNTDNYWNTDIKSVRNSLQSLNYSATPFELDNIIAKVKARKSAFKKDIIIITDAVGLDKKQLKNISSEDAPYFIIPKAEQKNNVAIDSVFISQTSDNFYDISINLSGYGDNFKPISMSLFNNDKLIAKTIVNFDTKKKKVNFTIPKQAFHGYLAIEDNGLEYDNRLYFSISDPKKTNVISIGDPAKSNFLSRIYTAEEFNYHNFDIRSLDYNSLDKQDAIILNELEEIPQALQTTLKSFVSKGGNVIIIPSDKMVVANMNSFLSNFGKVQMGSLENKEKLITKINFDHPIFSGVFENKIKNFQYPKTKTSFPITSSYSSALSYEDQSAFLTSIQNQVSAVSVFSAPINSVNSNFQQSPLIVPVFYKMAQNNQKSGINAIIIGNSQPYFVEALLSKDAILEVRGSDEQFIPIQQILNNKVKIVFNDYPEQAGNYTIYNKKEALENVSFNYKRSESDLSQNNSNLVSDYKTADTISTIFNTLQTERTDNEIWKWFVIFALLFLALEMAIIKFVK
ncbi:BatA and WFA domain-containing protein [Flavobacterium sp. LS1R47]|uniref:BatA and WFA domain-containing protein n=1 Tax=Flavobacterium frigoritolerans TaxID=2987686 RepID=A0A9X2ZL86_9FLAO|nr:BatA and WFA domain-containing protein [Flavobacterium frigoritolerans]MCV9930696.1 BatA and WFA domain-containing protein [Flavobacterium frigoritolerans]